LGFARTATEEGSGQTWHWGVEAHLGSVVVPLRNQSKESQVKEEGVVVEVHLGRSPGVAGVAEVAVGVVHRKSLRKRRALVAGEGVGVEGVEGR